MLVRYRERLVFAYLRSEREFRDPPAPTIFLVPLPSSASFFLLRGYCPHKGSRQLSKYRPQLYIYRELCSAPLQSIAKTFASGRPPQHRADYLAAGSLLINSPSPAGRPPQHRADYPAAASLLI